MKKTYIIIAAVVVVLWGGFMGFRHTKKNESLRAHHEDTYKRMVEVAQKSPRAGLDQMGYALNRYYEDNKKYPAGLIDLYPKYIASQAFITEISWSYEPKGNDFFLSKAVVVNERQMVASVNKSLKPEIETGVAVARRPEPAIKEPVVVEEAPPVVEPVAVAELEIIKEVKMTSSETGVVAAAAGSDLPSPSVSLSKAVDVQREMSRIVSMVGPEIASEEKAEFVSRSLERYLVWRDKKGFIGVGNIQYPEVDDMYIAVHDTWYSVKRRISEGQLIDTLFERKPATAEEKKSGDHLAWDLSKQFLVWKDNNGVIGVGNTQYPDEERLTIASQDEWGVLKREPLLTSPVAVEKKIQKEQVDVDELATSLSHSYLVWKDENGVIGVGNIQFPDRERLKIATVDKWETLREKPLSQERKTPDAWVKQQEQNVEGIVSRFSHNYLVWKDKNGVIGFGNVQYPEMNNISYVHSDQSWEKVVN